MAGNILDALHQAISSPWIYLLLFALAAVDSFFPVIPGEAALVTVAVFAASGEASVALTIVAGAAGAFAGDHISYLIGRGAVGRLRERFLRHSRSRAAYEWAEATLAARGGQVLLASRYVPGVRTATTITMGTVRYRLSRFTLWDLAAASFWATGWSLVGYFGGATFGNNPLKGLAFGLGLALALMVAGEGARRLWKAYRSRKSAGRSEDVEGEHAERA